MEIRAWIVGSIVSFVALVAFAEGEGPSAEQLKPLTIDSEYFDLNGVKVTDEYFNLVSDGLEDAEAVFTREEFLDIIAAKSDWTYLPVDNQALSGDQIAELVRMRKHVDTEAVVKPKISFYTPPKYGKDVCGGVSIGSLKRTKSTGCTINGAIYKNLDKLGNSSEVVSGFAVHEWFHAAGFGHSGNSFQCRKKKRNSVPIYAGCAAQSVLLGKGVDQCAKPC